MGTLKIQYISAQTVTLPNGMTLEFCNLAISEFEGQRQWISGDEQGQCTAVAVSLFSTDQVSCCFPET